MTEQELFEKADTIVYNFSEKGIKETWVKLSDVIAGKLEMNRDGKRVLCQDMNAWTDFVAGNEAENYPHYFVDDKGVIMMTKAQDL